jgi:hypothetical protein
MGVLRDPKNGKKFKHIALRISPRVGWAQGAAAPVFVTWPASGTLLPTLQAMRMRYGSRTRVPVA